VNTGDSIVPVTIKQINEALEDGGELLIDLQPRRHVAVIGLVCRGTRDEISRTYTLDDGTGTIVVQDFTHDLASAEPVLELHTYAYVVGRVMVNEREITAFCVRRVDDFNQIPFHLMQALYVHLHSVCGLPHGSVYAAVEAQGHPQSAAHASPPADRIGQAILAVLRRGNVRTGTHRRAILAGLAGQFSVEEIDRGLERLRQNCDVYVGQPDCWIAIS
jgi:hypothetical protein